MKRKIVLGDAYQAIRYGEWETGVVVGISGRWFDVWYPSSFGLPTSYNDQSGILPTLHLPIKGQWFDLILSGEKKEEYRDLKLFYSRRFGFTFLPIDQTWMKLDGVAIDFKVLHLTHGYDPMGKQGNPSRQLWANIESITVGKGNPEWGAPDCDVFIIKLGEIFHTKNVVK